MKIKYIFSLTLSLFLLTAATAAPAEIYKWVDDQGKIHYGDASKQKPGSLEKIVIQDKYSVRQAKQQTPIQHDPDQPSRTVVLNDFTMELPGSDVRNILVGRIVCKQPVDLYWASGLLKIERKSLGPMFTRVLTEQGYRARVGDVVRAEGELQLSGKINKIFLNTCIRNKKRNLTQDSTYLRIEWTLFDPLKDKVVLEVSSEGSHHGIKLKPVENGRVKSIDQALEVALVNLLANPKFVAKLDTPVDLEVVREQVEKISLKLNYSDRQSSFEEEAEQLKDRTVIVKTKEGHGSGVFIAEGGYILTNAHVVGDEKEFEILSGSGNYQAKLLRKNDARDVALLRVDEPFTAPSPVSISRKPSGIGEELYVIGTPLDIKFSQTITRGIVSAKRMIRGMNFIQTDAAINFGNSGGPVFNRHGELVAITVSSVMTREGASMNINYLIPIDDALHRLDIDGDYSTLSMLDNIIPSINIKQEMKKDSVRGRVIKMIYDWLNQPVFHL